MTRPHRGMGGIVRAKLGSPASSAGWGGKREPLLSPNTYPCIANPLTSRIAFTSRIGDCPKNRLYSRLN
jgi:hypothetical protein